MNARVLREHDLACQDGGEGLAAKVLESHYRGSYFSQRLDLAGAEVWARDDKRRAVDDEVRITFNRDPWYVPAGDES